MLETIEDYSRIRDTILFAENSDGEIVPRATIDTDVLGIREQVRLPRLVDQYYLNEINGLYSGKIPNAVEFEWPIHLSTALPTPDLSNYVDENKLENLSSLDEVDLFYFSGGENPDLDELNRQYETAKNNKLSADKNSLSNYNQVKADLLSVFNDDMLELSSLREEISSNFEDIEKERDRLLKQAERVLKNDLSTIEAEIVNVNRQYSKGEITEGQWNNLRSNFQEDIYDKYSENRTEVDDVLQEYTEQFALMQELLRDNQLSINNRKKRYNSDLSSAYYSYQDDLQNNERNFKTIENDIYLRSNSQLGFGWYKNLNDIYNSIAQLSIYPAENNVQKAIPWAPSSQITSFIEYNDRLYADWEKCKWKKISDYSVEKKIPGYDEEFSEVYRTDDVETEYGTIPGYTVTTNLNNFIEGDNILYEREYLNDDDHITSESEYFFDTDFNIWLGNRNEANNIIKVKVIVRFDGFGEGTQSLFKDKGSMYALLDCTKADTQSDDYLSAWDAEEDRHLSSQYLINDTYKNSIISANFQHQIEIENLETSCDFDIAMLSSQAYMQKHLIQGQYISGLESVILEANRKYFAGEDNEAEILEIDRTLMDLFNELAPIDEKLNTDMAQRMRKFNQDKHELELSFQQVINGLYDVLIQQTNEENRINSQNKTAIQSDYYEEFGDYMEAAEQVKNDSIEEARNEFNEYSNKVEEERLATSKELVEKWNQHFEDYPELKFDKDYDIITDGYNQALLPNKQEKQWAFDQIRLPMENWKIAQQQPNSDAVCKRNSAYQDAERQYRITLAEFGPFLPKNREKWKFDAEYFQIFGEDFTTKQEFEFKSGFGDKGVWNCQILGVFALIDYGAATGVEYPDYKKLDKGEILEESENS